MFAVGSGSKGKAIYINEKNISHIESQNGSTFIYMLGSITPIVTTDPVEKIVDKIFTINGGK